jgi:hypothetical protein
MPIDGSKVLIKRKLKKKNARVYVRVTRYKSRFKKIVPNIITLGWLLK